ncbi:MAG: type II toxin-antitoxin system VapC family toxin [Candidatus Thermoplasmatota archaeon]|jgi:predicted nucleic acid-binding protein|nr:type II toxin-antitoxin system VapC family toxin [Candidatus Thermoplasmatota archaeon]
MIADTSFLIDIMKSDKDAIRKAEEIEKKGNTIAVTSITIFELFIGVSLSIKQDQERNKINRILNGLSIISFDEDSAREAGKIYAQKRKNGSAIEPEDSMIAGICSRRNEILITRNIKHFSDIEGLRIESY